MKIQATSSGEYGLIVSQSGTKQSALSRFVTLMLNYQYGIGTIVADSVAEGLKAHEDFDQQIRCVFLIESRTAGGELSIGRLNRMGACPLIILVPAMKIRTFNELRKGVKNVTLCPWEKAFYRSGSSLRQLVEGVFEANGLTGMLGADSSESYELLQERIAARLEDLDTLPGLPGIAFRVMKMIANPATTAADLDRVILTDPAMVQGLIRAVNSPLFAGAADRERLSLREAIVRLGHRKVGAIAVQVALINSFVKPEESLFDLPRF